VRRPDVPLKAAPAKLPQHLAVIMDGNGRWARARKQPRAMGHRAGVRATRNLVRTAARLQIPVLTIFAFSQENWARPEAEVRLLMQLFARTLVQETDALHDKGVRMRFIGDHAAFEPELRAQMHRAEQVTAANTRLTLVIAVGYSGQWDILQAAQRLCAQGQTFDAETLAGGLSTAGLPPPDLIIRTGGEQRISNFLLWQAAYSELYFTETLWPDFDAAALDQALHWYAGRQRRFGRVLDEA
jgi:undecaprenyl diphosphate synthase